jgi:uncharacterized protein YcfL
MRSRAALLLASLLLGGCSSLNDALVRSWMQDRELGERVNAQIREGLERRKSAPEKVLPKKPAPPFLDQG